jgi:hypothetical protein
MKKNFISVIVFIIVFVLNSCQLMDDIFDDDVNDKEHLITKKIEGKVILPENSKVKNKDLKIVGLSDSGFPDENGKLELALAKHAKHQVLISTNSKNKPLLLGLVNPETDKFEVSPVTTAKSLVLMNPVFLLTSGEQRGQLLSAAEIHPGFNNLVTSIEQLLINDPDNILNINFHPKIYEQAANISLDLLRNSEYSGIKSALAEEKRPWIESSHKGEISIYNPKSIYFAAEFTPKIDETSSHLITAKSSLISFGFTWPPVYFTEPTENIFKIKSDNSYQVLMTKGFDFSTHEDILNINTINGKATLCNLGKTTGLLLDLIIGMDIPITGFLDLAFDGKKNIQIMLRLGNHITDGDVMGVIYDVCDFVIINKDRIFYFLRQELNPANGDNIDEYLSQAFSILQNVAVVTKIISVGSTASNKLIPFVYDLISGDRSIQYTFIMNNGQLSSSSLNAPPKFVKTQLTKDEVLVNSTVSVSVSAFDPDNDKILYRIHWGDGNASEWSGKVLPGASEYFSYQYNSSGIFKIVAEVMDERGAVGELSEYMPVTVYSSEEYFTYDFENDMVGGLPQSPPWQIKQNEPSYIRITNQGFGASNQSCMFVDYDPHVVNNDENGGVAQIILNKKLKDDGIINFSCKVSDMEDDFGVRAWQDDNFNWSEMGFYICFYKGNICYYRNGEFIQIMTFQADYWYDFTINYNTSEKVYSIYVNGELKVHDAKYNGNPYQLTKFQAVAFSDASCKMAFIDNIRLPVHFTKNAVLTPIFPNHATTIQE